MNRTPLRRISRKDTLERIVLVLLWQFVLTVFISAQPGQVTHSVIVIGNLRDVKDMGHFTGSIARLTDTISGNHTIILAGDGARVDDGAPDTGDLVSFISALRAPGKRKFVILDGDRDWDDSGQDGWVMIRETERQLEPFLGDDILWPLKGGCPGPERIALDLTLNLLVVSTQWWNHPYDKPTPATAACKIATREELIEEIRDEIEDASYGNLIIAGHYPVISNGQYGGRFPAGKWLFPVPLVSTMQTAYRQNIGGPREIINEEFLSFKEEMEDLLEEYSSITYVSGHEHNREVLEFSQNILVGSGSPEKGEYVKRRRETFFGSSDPGIEMIQYDVSGNEWVVNYRFDRQGNLEVESRILVMQAPCKLPLPDVVVNERLVPCLDEDYVLTDLVEDHPDSLTVAANNNYAAGGFQRMLLGSHYRDEWTAEVRVPVLDLDTFAGGLRPYAIGGGRQTISLKLVGDDGLDYVFRSVDKDPSRALSIDLRNTLISLAARDQTTTEHPYGAVVASALLDSLDILHAHPSVCIIPDDPMLGPFRETYGGLLGMIEEFPTGRKEAQRTFSDADEILRTVRMYRGLFELGSNRIEAREYARARIFDMLVGDWGKHADNWKWAGFESDTGVLYRPIPRDRDHVFSLWDGILPWIADREWAKPAGENFGFRIRDIRSLMWQARHSDRLLLTGLEQDDWLRESQFIRHHLSDRLIDSAVMRVPEGIDSSSSSEIAAKLKARLADLDKYTIEYYELLAKEVNIVGTIQDERFELERMPDGRVAVDVFSRNDEGNSFRIYSRIFDPGITREIRLFGVLGCDTILINGNVEKSILVRVIPGAGHDWVIDNSDVRKRKQGTMVYTRDNDEVNGGPSMKLVDIPYKDAYRFRIDEFQYNTYLPSLYMFYSGDEGFQIGGGIRFTRHAYNKPDYSSIHNISVRASTFGNIQFLYSGTFRHVLGGFDLVANAMASHDQRFNYFFGIGNDTKYNIDSLRNGYYSLRNSTVLGAVGLRRTFLKRSNFSLLFNLSSNSGESGTDNIFEGNLPDAAGAVPLRTAEIRALVEIDLRDRDALPSHGMRLVAEGSYAKSINVENTFGTIKGFLEWYGTARPFTLGLRAGGWAHSGVPPYYSLQYLGLTSFLRGYRRNRFAGRQAAFFNSDLRIQILDNKNWLIPHKIGLLGFYDVGRVFVPGESSNTWHMGYGGGFYLVPIRERFTLTFTFGFSEEETAFFRFGFGKTL